MDYVEKNILQITPLPEGYFAVFAAEEEENAECWIPIPFVAMVRFLPDRDTGVLFMGMDGDGVPDFFNDGATNFLRFVTPHKTKARSK